MESWTMSGRALDPHDARAAALALLRDKATASEGRRLLERAAAAHPASPSVPTPPEETAALEAWCEEFLHPSPGLCVRTFEQTGRGLAAGSGGLAAGEVALRIPLRVVLSSQALPRHPLLDAMHEDLRLAIALLHEPVRDPQGPWARYTPLLPARPPSALGWTASQLACMASTPLPYQVAQLRQALELAYSEAFPSL